MEFEVDTDVPGACELLLAGARINVRDCLKSERLMRVLAWRCAAPERIEYTRDTKRVGGRLRPIDRWTTVAILAERYTPAQPWKGDCEDITMAWGAYLALRGAAVWVCICQPHQEGTAHAFLRVGPEKRVWDACVWHGMQKPTDDFYDRGETAAYRVEVPS